MRVWPLASVMVLVAGTGCHSKPTDYSSKRHHDEDSTSSSESTSESSSTRSSDADSSKWSHYTPYSSSSHGPYSYGYTGNAQFNLGSALLATPLAKSYMMKSDGGAVLGGLGFLILVSALESGPLTYIMGSNGVGLILAGGVTSLFAVRSAVKMDEPDGGKARPMDDSDDGAPKRPKKKKRMDDGDPDMTPPPAPPPMGE